MKKFIEEFKKFITRGNVVDMAVGVIVGSSFTAIVNGLSNNVLKPVINWVLFKVFGDGSLSDVYTMLHPAYTKNEAGLQELDLSQSIYIDWGAFINAIINFFIVVFVLFTIVKFINRVRERQAEINTTLRKGKPTKEEKAEMKALGINLRNKEAVAAYYAEKAKKAEEEKLAAEEKARLEAEENPPVEKLLKDIRDLLKNKA